MDLKQALKWANEKYESGEHSDGCSYSPDLGIKKFCYMHDFLRRFRPDGMSLARTDNLFFQGICTKGKRYYPVAAVYWLFVRLQGIIGYKGLAFLGVGVAVLILMYFQPEV